MKIIKNKLEKEIAIRTEKDFPIKGIEFIDITPLTLQKEVYHEIIEDFTSEIQNKQVEYIIAPEARGFLFGSSVASNLDIGCIPVRKKGKLPPTSIEAEFEYEKEYGKDILCLPKLVEGEYKDKNFYIIDDIYATGNTIKYIQNQIIKLGGNVVGTGVVMNIVGLNKDKDIYSILEVEEE